MTHEKKGLSKVATILPTTPRGFRDVLPYEASRREYIVQKVNDTFDKWGYQPVELPLLEDDEVLKLGGQLPSTPFKLFDRDGRLLVLRSDVTLPIARMAATKLVEDGKELRLRYVAPVFREQDSFMGASRQFTQLGIECINKSGVAADAEVVGLLAATLEALNLKNAVIALGSVEPLTALVSAAQEDKAWQQTALDFFHNSDFVGFNNFVDETDMSDAFKEALRAIPRTQGGLEALDTLDAALKKAGLELETIPRLKELYTRVKAMGTTTELVFDFSVMSSFDYYTGMVFDAFAPGVGSSLGGGGRYNNALGKFGTPAPAAGFALSLEAVREAYYAENAESDYRRKEVVLLAGDNLAEVAEMAQVIREEGKACIISEYATSEQDEKLMAEAERCNADSITVVLFSGGPEDFATEYGDELEEDDDDYQGDASELHIEVSVSDAEEA